MTTLSIPAALKYLQDKGATADQARELLRDAPVAARWNTGFGRVAYYYARDLEKIAEGACNP